MKKFVLEEIKLISQTEQRANSFIFDKGFNVITGQNGVGKSHLIKSIPWVFGAEPSTIHPSWAKANISVILKFSVDNLSYKILRTGKTFLVFDNNNNLINRSVDSITKELAPFLSDLFGFDLKLPLKEGDKKLTQLPPAYYFSPFYVDQDSGWMNLWQSFKNLQMFSNWRRPLLDTFTNILSLELQKTKNLIMEEKNKLKEFEKRQDLFNDTFKDSEEEIISSDFDINFDDYKKEIDELMIKLDKLQEKEFKYKENIRILSNKKNIIENQINIVDVSILSLNKEHNLINKIENHILECPTCGAEYENSFIDRFNIAQDLYTSQELLIDLKEDLNKINNEILDIKNIDINNLKEINNINDILSKKNHNLTIKEIIKKEGKKHFKEFLRIKSNDISNVIDKINLKIIELNKKERTLIKQVRQQKIAVEQFFIISMEKSLEGLNVKNLMLDDYKDMYSGNVPEAGSDKPRAFLAHVFSLINTINNFNDGILPPIIIDSPNQQDQDPGNIDRIYNFIITERPMNHQMILGLANGEDRDFGECNKIILKDERFLLSEEKYDEVKIEFHNLLSIGLLDNK